eukprot:562634-Pleurochrysis_carterae.AAC.1
MERRGRGTVAPIWPVLVSPDATMAWAIGRAVNGGPEAPFCAPRGRRRAALSGVAIHAPRLNEVARARALVQPFSLSADVPRNKIIILVKVRLRAFCQRAVLVGTLRKERTY